MDGTLIVVRVWVRDWDAAVRFYTETLGLPLAFKDADMGWAQLATGQAQLAIERFCKEDASPEERALVGRFVGVSLAVDDIYAVHRDLSERGFEFVAPPEVMPRDGVLANLRDPEGNVITLAGTPKRA